MGNKGEMININNNANLRELQLKSLEILLYFKDFCEKHDLIFYLCGGCCIGAIRHKGFIPWDDDIDVFMPRNDYEDLERLWKRYADTKRYSYCRTNKEQSYETMLTQISDNNTTFIKTQLKDFDINHGIKLEIIPLDGAPNSKLKRKIQMFWAIIFNLFNREVAPENKGRLANILGKIALGLFYTKSIRYRIWYFAQEQMSKYPINERSKYITELTVTFKYMKNLYPKEYFKKAIYKEFEGYQMPVPIGFDGYLTMAFGNYMKLPNKKEQIPSHEAVYINTTESYKTYKGIYYCREEKR